ncbi:hypothetical protein NIIDMKKI_78060 [Mycobacterium kansasii]|uniref:HAD hydrolase, IIB family protein n=1 Tax=Mycobacterium kansasii TaxID=1768 RepID=A0A7G1IP16_MYCKA|nr:hypothetical protein NIIDMKKI_78060 [Mycobacterium kansasii]
MRAAVAGGATFILATGRPPRWVRPVVDALGFAPMAVCANGAVIYDPATDRVVSAHTLSVDALAALAEIARRVIPGSGLAVERIGDRAHDTATPQFVSSPGYEHAWLNPDHTQVSIEDLLSAPAIKLLIRKTGATSAEMVAQLAKHVGSEGEITYSTNNGLVEVVPRGISKATGVQEIGRPLGIADAGVVAFGDMPNDVPMLLRAGLGWRWAMRIPTPGPPPTRSPLPTTTTASRGCWSAGGPDPDGTADVEDCPRAGVPA